MIVRARRGGPWALGFLWFLFGGPAAAQLDVPGWGEIVEASRDPVRQSALSREHAWTDFLRRYPGWTAEWDEARGVPERASGPGLRLDRVPAAPEEASALVARLVSRDAAPWLAGVTLDPVRSVRQGNTYWVQFVQRHRGVRVAGAKVHARVGADGTVPVLGLDVVPGLDLDVAPRVTETAARLGAVDGFSADVDAPDLELVIAPVPGEKNAYRLVWEARFHTVSPPGDWVAQVDAETGALLRRVNQARSEDVTGTVRAHVELVESGGPLGERALRYVGVSAEDGESAVAGDAVTDIDGEFAVGSLTPGPYTVQAPLSGPYGVIYNHRHDLETPRLSLPVTVPGTADPYFTGANSRVQDRDAFYWAMIAHDYIRHVEAAFDPLDYPMPIVVDVMDEQCNAFWNGEGILFFEAGGPCPAAARSPSVVIHEYGHGVTDFQYRPFAPSGAMHEGFSDYFAATALDDPIIGRGFRGPGTYIRTVDNNQRWPQNVIGEPHYDGLIIAGALWDMRQALGRTLADSLWHYARYGLSDTYDRYFFDLLLADDDNANVYDGTPHFAALVAAFRGHGIGDYGIHVAHDPLADSEDTGKSFPLRAGFFSLFDIVDSTVTAHVELVAGDTTSLALPMTPTGDLRTYAATLGPQNGGTLVRYWFTARDIEGPPVTDPPQGAGDPFAFLVGPDVTPPVVVHEPLPDQPLGMPVVRFRALVHDNLDHGLGGVSAFHAVNGAAEDTSPLAAVQGDRHEGTLSTLGLAVGDAVRYRLLAVDSALAANVTRVPEAGEYEFHLVRGHGFDFEADDGGFLHDGDWAWGEDPTPRGAYSGTRVWSTGLLGHYRDNQSHDLLLGPFDLTEFTRASLAFRHAYDIEAGYDGGNVYASMNGGATWALLEPEGGYPVASLVVNGLPGYSGKQPDWAPAAFDLSPYRGAPDVRIRFRLQSDPGVNAAGWFLDDVQIVERQVLARPREIRARSGRDGFVPLSWQPPIAVDPEAPDTPLLGYHVYRAEGESSFEKLTASPWTEAAYTDSTAVNGTSYRYRVTSVYADGESPPTADAAAMAYVAAYASEQDSLEVGLAAGASTARVLPVTNAGTGFLRVAVWPAEENQSLDSVRVRLPVVESPEYRILFTDADEPIFAGMPDLASLEAAVDRDTLRIRLSSHEIWATFQNDFNLQVGFDVDGNPGTGPRGDFYLLAGFTPLTLQGAPALLFRENGLVVGAPLASFMPNGSDTASWSLFLGDLGYPESLEISAYTLSTNLQTLDRLPDAPALSWFQPGRRFLEVTPDLPQTLAVDFLAQGLSLGAYRGRILLETNDPLRPEVVVPVSLTVGTTPVDLLEFTGASGDEGVTLRWRTAEETDHAGFHVLRRGPGEETDRRLTAQLLTGGNGVYAYEDRDVLPDATYAYRLAEVSRSGDVTLHGPVLVRFTGTPALLRPVLRPAAPNPFFDSALLRFGLPEEAPVSLVVFGIDGRRVRTLLSGAPTPAGFHDVAWDGRDDAGRSVAAGVYTVRFTAGETRLAHKLVLAR